jgi:hypothetical protein
MRACMHVWLRTDVCKRGSMRALHACVAIYRCMYAWAYACMHACVAMYRCMYAWEHACIACMHACERTYVNVGMHACERMYVNVGMHACMRPYVCVRGYVCIRPYVCVCGHGGMRSVCHIRESVCSVLCVFFRSLWDLRFGFLFHAEITLQ